MSRRIVLDTTIFTDPNVAREFSGPCTRENVATWALKNVLLAIDNKRSDDLFMTTPQIWEELIGFVDKSKLDKRLFLNIAIKSPSPSLQIPSFLFMEYIKDMRKRLNDAEKRGVQDIRKGLNVLPSEKKKGGPEPSGDIVSNWRKTFRHMTREGTVDSEADMSLILLAYQHDAAVVSTDKGLISWAHKLGLQVIDANLFKDIII